MRNYYGLFILYLTTLLFSCSSGAERVKEKDIDRESITVPEFNSDSAYAFIQAQVDFGPRVPNTNAHVQCGDYLVKKLEEFGAEVIEQEFTATAFSGENLALRNIIGSINPAAKKRILLAAHWDTRPFADKDVVDQDKPIDGANDGASGVGVLLEIARAAQTIELGKVGIDIIFFDGEDYGEREDIKMEIPEYDASGRMMTYWCLGSQHWSKNLHKPKYRAYYGILLDMVGARGSTFYMEGASMQFAPKIVKKVWVAAHDLGHGSYFPKRTASGVTDDHIFVNRDAKIPMIDIIHYDPASKKGFFGDYHHTHQDNMSIIDRQTLQAVGETVLFVVYNEK